MSFLYLGIASHDYIDIFRQFNDPMTSYWRIDKAVKRGGLLFKHYPLIKEKLTTVY